ncbi:hypothetical protein AVV49_gp60 [Pseudomonas phage PaMx74]|uniref:Uncharacterized protein n=1 Tax=Pseudomonas phage PaMx74 TaxID=1175663 RepID=A0A0S0N9G6_9CAUD|nr:hypothetical protein AVV49_gp60 [Pseudomonas phage PaMx74]ALH23485.1 hypothetical protein PaMx74_60 [Pseudomonas phage PaMx74]
MVTFTKYHHRRRYADWRDPPSRCDCCGEATVALTSNSAIYGREYGDWPYVYLCLLCGASVGTHPHSVYPLGLMADKETRALRTALHAIIDPAWKSGRVGRSELYRMMADALGLPRFHVGDLSREQCRLANEAFRAWETAADFGDDP